MFLFFCIILGTLSGEVTCVIVNSFKLASFVFEVHPTIDVINTPVARTAVNLFFKDFLSFIFVLLICIILIK